MRVKILLIFLIGILLVLPTLGKSTEQHQEVTENEEITGTDKAHVVHPELPRITAEELRQLIVKKDNFVLVDTRDRASYDKGHVKGAINIYYDPVGDPMAREFSLMALPIDKLLIIYSNCEDDEISTRMVMELFDLGYDLDMIKIVSRGIIRWNELGYPLIATGE
jgi:rhodanese-related sulfurtransferase